MKIVQLGHDIGLHFDETRYEIAGQRELYVEAVEMELSILRRVLCVPVKAVSMHRPTSFTLEADLTFPTAVNSYSKKFFKECKYLSDSRRQWRENVLEVVASGEFNNLHLLTHPFWYNKKEMTAVETLERFIHAATAQRYGFLQENFTNLSEYVKG